MGSFSLSVLVGLCIFLPGAAFVLGLRRLYNPSAPGSPIDQHFSAGLALPVASNVLLHGIGFSLAAGYTRSRGLPEPDIGPVLALLSGDLKSAWGMAGAQSLTEFPLRIPAYFLTKTVVAWGVRNLANLLIGLRPRRWLPGTGGLPTIAGTPPYIRDTPEGSRGYPACLDQQWCGDTFFH